MRSFRDNSPIYSPDIKSAKRLVRLKGSQSNSVVKKKSFREFKPSISTVDQKPNPKLRVKSHRLKGLNKSLGCLNFKMKPRLRKKSSLRKSLKLPASPSKVIRHKSLELTEKEMEEMQNCLKVFYLGKRKAFPDTVGDQIAFRYEILGFIGKGSFGSVYKVFDHKKKVEAAIKVINKSKTSVKYAQIEAKILKYLKGKSKYIVGITNSFVFRGKFCITFELLGPSLYELMVSNDRLPLEVIKAYGKQIFRALTALHKLKVIHCDLKPENILLTSKLSLKLIDFGSSCFKGKSIFNYIQSRFYRAPEVLFGMEYSTKIDVWSAGCILAEMRIGRPIFTGASEMDQIKSIISVLGNPPASLTSNSCRNNIELDNGNSSGFMPKVLSLEVLLNSENEEFIDLVSSCLRWDPLKRTSASNALQHAFFTKD